MTAAGYSGTPLAKKLGLKDRQKVVFIGLPERLADLTTCRAFAEVVQVESCTGLTPGRYDYIQMFTSEAREMHGAVPALRDRIEPDGMIWICWPKKASKVPTDVTGDVVRSCALADILVDVKVCAVDDVWSGLKLVIRKEHRAAVRKADGV